MSESEPITLTTNPLITQVRSLIHREQKIDTDPVFARIRELEQTIERYESAGFTALANTIRAQLRPQHDILRRVQQELKAAQLRDAGYLIINLPKWDGYYQRTVTNGYKFLKTKPSSLRSGFHYVPGKIIRPGHCDSILCRLCSQRKACPKADCTVLWMVQTQNFTSPVPDFVIDRVLEEKETFAQFDILFVAKKSELLSIVRDFDVMVDPILVGRWSVGQGYNRRTNELEPTPTDRHAVVLAMWGDDLEEIDLALALSQEVGKI